MKEGHAALRKIPAFIATIIVAMTISSAAQAGAGKIAREMMGSTIADMSTGDASESDDGPRKALVFPPGSEVVLMSLPHRDVEGSAREIEDFLGLGSGIGGR